MRFLRGRRDDPGHAPRAMFHPPSSLMLSVLFVRQWYDFPELVPEVPPLRLNVPANPAQQPVPRLLDYCAGLWKLELDQPDSGQRSAFPDPITEAFPGHQLGVWMADTLPPLAYAIGSTWQKLYQANEETLSKMPHLKWVILLPVIREFALFNPAGTGLLISSSILDDPSLRLPRAVET